MSIPIFPSYMTDALTSGGCQRVSYYNIYIRVLFDGID